MTNTVSTLYGWTREQWRVAFQEFGVEFDARSWRDACVLGSVLCADVQGAWYERHVFDPLKSPIVIPDSYRTRAYA